MKRSRLLMGVLGSSVMLGGAMFTAPRVTHSSSMWYLAGQFKMALGDTTGGLQLMSRAAKERQQEQGIQIPAAKPSPAQTKTCSNRSQAAPAVATSKPRIENAKVDFPQAKQRVLVAKLDVPENPFAGQDVAALTPEQIQRATARYEVVVQRWASEQNEQKLAMLHQRMNEQAKVLKARHPQFVHVVVPDALPFPEPPATPQVTP